MTETNTPLPNIDTRANRNQILYALGRLLPFLLVYRARLIWAGVALLCAAITTLILPLAVRRVVDFGFGNDSQAGNIGLVSDYFVFLLILAVALAGFSALRYYMVTWLGERIVSDIRQRVFSHLSGLSADFYDKARSGEILSRLTADTALINTAVSSSISVALRNIILLIGAISMMVVTSWQLSILVLVAIPLIVLPLVAFGRKVRERSRKAQDSLADASAQASEILGAIRIIQSFSYEEQARKNFSRAIDTAFNAARLTFATRAWLVACVIFLVFASIIAVLWIGAQQVTANTMSIGTLGQFILYSVFAAASLSQISQVTGELSQAAGASERLVELLDTPPTIAAPETVSHFPKQIKGAISFNSVSFHYPGNPDKPILHDFSCHITPGQTIAFVGSSGAGKSTLFQLLNRFYDPQQGSISLDGEDIRNFDPTTLRAQMALVAQDPTIFGISIADNIRMANPQASRKEIIAAAQVAQIDETISRMPQGYDSLVGERGITLSGGQRQRIAIARALLKNAPILLLDEATSALDSENEHSFQLALDKVMENRTTLIIAHRLASVLKADRIFLLHQGKILQSGTHEELMAGESFYKRLAELQFTG